MHGVVGRVSEKNARGHLESTPNEDLIPTWIHLAPPAFQYSSGVPVSTPDIQISLLLNDDYKNCIWAVFMKDLES